LLVALNPYYAMAALYLTLGAFTALEMVLANFRIVAPMTGQIWMRVHMIVLGGIAQVVFGTLPKYWARRSGMAGPDHATQWRLWGMLNVGIVVSMVGMVSNRIYMFATGATITLLAVTYLFVILWRIGSKGRVENRLMTRFLALGAFYLFLGITMALTYKVGWPPAPAGPAGAREAHIHANAWGFINVVVAVSIFEFLPMILGRPLVYPTWNRFVWWMLAIGDFLLILGPWWGKPIVTTIGLFPYAAGVVAMYINIVATVIKAKAPNPVSGWHFITGYFWLALPAALAPFVMLAGAHLPVGRIEVVAVQSLISGWALQIAMATVPTMLTTLQSGEAPVPCDNGAHKKVLWLALALMNSGPAMFWVAGFVMPEHLYSATLAVGYSLIVLAWIPFLARVWRSLTTSARPV